MVLQVKDLYWLHPLWSNRIGHLSSKQEGASLNLARGTNACSLKEKTLVYETGDCKSESYQAFQGRLNMGEFSSL